MECLFICNAFRLHLLSLQLSSAVIIKHLRGPFPNTFPRESFAHVLRTFRLQVMHSNDLKEGQCNSIWSLFETNMRGMYEASSFGWDPQAKQKELFHSLSRFLLVTDTEKSELVAFTNFRFEVEGGEDLIYCYDLQVSPSTQGVGLGKNMMKELEKIAQSYNMEKIALTVFKANTKAAAFYKAFGFELDLTSPNFLEEEDELDPDEVETTDYEILSKGVPPKLAAAWAETS
ncbi:acyl-CoA N-acyltransferase [Pholiota conissans]|uniref:N-alpha-acetyltransferase 40 n=1 Tax=Pholiota conissans TaxID=109636 RepID=A0A9P5Z7C9_9AGAR|nr:acyl-CoA N-acyltransferase [Pholiota conissans]